MRLHLISPTHYQRTGALVKTTRYWTSGLTLPTLKALTPREWDVKLTDELIEDVDLDHPCDVVGITAMGPESRRVRPGRSARRPRAQGRARWPRGRCTALRNIDNSPCRIDPCLCGCASPLAAARPAEPCASLPRPAQGETGTGLAEEPRLRWYYCHPTAHNRCMESSLGGILREMAS